MPETALSPAQSSNYLDTESYRNNYNKSQLLTAINLKQRVVEWLEESGFEKNADKIRKCGQLFIPFSDSQGYMMYKRTFCRDPLCPICAETGSAYNLRRAKSVKKDMLGRGYLGHLVLTVPKEISESMPERDKIEQLFKLAVRVLKEGFDAEAGALALHLTGDKTLGLHLHFDCVFFLFHRGGDCQYKPFEFQQARIIWTQGVNEIFGSKYRTTVLHYNFALYVDQQHHLINYLTRSTISPDKFFELSEEARQYAWQLSRIKTLRKFGKLIGKKKQEFLKWHPKYADEKKDYFDDLIERHINPITMEKMKPGKPVYKDDLPLNQLVWYNQYVLIDREIASFIKQQEQKRWQEEYRRLQEIEDLEKLGLVGYLKKYSKAQGGKGGLG